MKKIYTADRETGTFIEECKSIEEAKKLIASYEDQDKINDVFTEVFYDIVDENHCSINQTKKFEVKKEIAVVTNPDGVTLSDVEDAVFNCDNRDPEVIASFTSLGAATSFYDATNPHTTAHGDGKTYVCEYIYIEENVYDADGEFISGGDVYFGKTEEMLKGDEE